MVRDAEANAEADAKRKEAIEARNELDSSIYNTDKSFNENKEKLDDETKAEIEKALSEAREVKEDDDVETIKAKAEALSQASLKIGQAVYKDTQASSDEGAQGAESGEEKKEE